MLTTQINDRVQRWARRWLLVRNLAGTSLVVGAIATPTSLVVACSADNSVDSSVASRDLPLFFHHV
jgi:hypothetical protein